MIKVENIEAWGFEHAIRGMRNPMNSWKLSDSLFITRQFCDDEADMKLADVCHGVAPIIKSNDLQLMKKLFKAGTEHRKYLRQIFVSMDITAPTFWWQEFDTYKIGVTRNSCSKMHKIHVKEFTPDDFTHEGIDEVGGFALNGFMVMMNTCEWLREKFNETQDKRYWRALIELLPESYNMRATVSFSYENAVNMIRQRAHHKLQEWRTFIKILLQLPYLEQLLSVEVPEGMD